MNQHQRKDRIAKHAALHDAHRARSDAYAEIVLFADRYSSLRAEAADRIGRISSALESEKRESKNLFHRLRRLTAGMVDVYPDDPQNRVVTAQITISRRDAPLMYESATEFMRDALYQICSDLGAETIECLCRMFKSELQKPLAPKREEFINKSVYDGWKNGSQATPADYGRAWDSALRAIMEAATPKE